MQSGTSIEDGVEPAAVDTATPLMYAVIGTRPDRHDAVAKFFLSRLPVSCVVSVLLIS